MAGSQPEGPAKVCVVKNTFIEFEEAPPAVSDLRRAQTEQPRGPPVQADHDEDYHDASGDHLAPLPEGISPPTEVPGLCRHRTADPWEYDGPAQPGPWVGDGSADFPGGGHPPPPAPGQDPLAAPAGPTQSGPRICVRNTFLDIDRPPPVADLRRARSEGAAQQQQHLLPQPGPPEERQEPLHEVDDEDENQPDDMPPAVDPVLYRTQTQDQWESTRDWTWAHPTMPMAGQFDGMQGMQPGMQMYMAPPLYMMQQPGYMAGGPWPGAQGPCAGGPPAVAAPTLAQVEPPAPPPGAPSVSGGDPESASPTIEDRLMADMPEREPVLRRHTSVASQMERIRWTVDARKLRSTDREAVSPGFKLAFAREVDFKMVMKPKPSHDSRGGMSFKKAKGKGSIEVRCLEQVDPSVSPEMTFRIGVGLPQQAPEMRGPVTHNFADRALSGLPESVRDWDFSQHVDNETQTFVVWLEVAPRV